MSPLRPHKPTWLIWASGAALVLAGLAGLWYVTGSPSRHKARKRSVEPSLPSDGTRWNGLRHWLQDHPQDEDGWETLGHLLVRQGRSQEAPQRYATCAKGIQDG